MEKYTFTVTLDGKEVGKVVFHPDGISTHCDTPMMIQPLEALAQALADEMAQFAGVQPVKLKEEGRVITPIQTDEGGRIQ